MATTNFQFAKYHGLGNDFIVIDARDGRDLLSGDQCRKLCDRHFGIGGDGVLFALPPPATVSADFGMKVINSDGSVAMMCGNGIRCLAKFVYDKDDIVGCLSYKIWTDSGFRETSIDPDNDGLISVDMGKPEIIFYQHLDSTVLEHPIECSGKSLQATRISMGNPHAVIFLNAMGSTTAKDLDALGPDLSVHECFPGGSNIEFVEVVNNECLNVVVYERGAGKTLACGTGACAAVVACVLHGRVSRDGCVANVPGGPLFISWREDDGFVCMKGPAVKVFEGSLCSSFFES